MLHAMEHPTQAGQDMSGGFWFDEESDVYRRDGAQNETGPP